MSRKTVCDRDSREIDAGTEIRDVTIAVSYRDEDGMIHKAVNEVIPDCCPQCFHGAVRNATKFVDGYKKKKNSGAEVAPAEDRET
jgi:hypothetical protein